MAAGLTGLGLESVVSDDNGAVYTKGAVKPTSATSSTLSAVNYTATVGFLAKMTYPSKFLVEFKDWDGTVIQSSLVDEHGSVTPPEDPVREGYEFLGWDHEDSEFSDVVESITATAQYQILDTNFTVTFVDWDDGLISQLPVEKNTPVARPDDPVRPYYSFRAWKNGDAEWDFAAPVASNMTLRADYTISPVQDVADASSLVSILSAGLPDDVVIRLVDDIDFTGVDYSAVDFSGILDGNGHYIAKLPNGGRLFGSLYGTVHDLTLKDIGDGTAIQISGGVLANSAVGATVYNCVLENVNVEYKATNVRGGGFFSESGMDEGGVRTVISNCVVRNSRILTSDNRESQFVGGFAAVASNTSFVDCRLETSDSDSVTIGGMATMAGGIVAMAEAGVTVSRCSASGLVEAKKYVALQA